ncbi:sec1 family domain-containing protein 1 [Nematocida parisii]|nr:sec1 family domain-containing protein 1 [Nematocida parisii]KAI5140092.1 sec1 family domain-containing protein 1 [Nematocida parisii]
MLRERQAQELSGLLKGESFEWSVLILDKDGQDVISPLFIMTDLMEMGIVQCLKMEDIREQNLETRAVYLIKETEENISRILEDVKMQLYSKIEILFTGIISTSLLKDLAFKAAALKEASRIVRITDAITNISLLHESIYTMNMTKSFVETVQLAQKYITTGKDSCAERAMEEHYRALSNNSIDDSLTLSKEEVMNEHGEYFDKIVMGLSSVFKNGLAPAVFYNHPIAKKVSSELLDRLSDISEVMEKQRPNKPKKMKRPLLVILTRGEDLVTPLYHTNTYGAMLNEIFDFSLNKLVIHNPISKPQEKKEKETYNLNRYDTFYNDNIHEPFTTVVDRVNEDLQAYKELSQSASINMATGNDDMVRSLIQLPDLLGKNRLLYNHMNIVLNAIKIIQQKHLDELFAVEDGNALDMPEVEEIINKVELNDLIRLCAVVFSKFNKHYAEVSALAGKRIKNSKVLKYIENNTVQHSTRKKILHNIKKMIGVQKDGIIKRVDEVWSGKTEDFSSLNIFILGGGTYDEYTAVLEYGKAHKIEVTYGSTEIFSASSFMAQIDEIA